MAPPPLKPPVIPPATTAKGKSRQAIFQRYVNSHGLQRYAGYIYKYAVEQGVDPIHFAALIFAESHGRQVDPKTGKIITSSAGALGIGQIMPLHVGDYVPWRPQQPVTLADLHNVDFNLHFAAYFFGTKVKAAGGDYVKAYNGPGGYNQGGPDIFTGKLPKGTPFYSGPSPQDSADLSKQKQNDLGKIDAGATSWAVYRNGKLRFIKTPNGYNPVTGATPNPPKGTLHVFGSPVSEQQFRQTWNTINQDYQAYTGNPASKNQAAMVISNGWSETRLKTYLTNQPGFFNSSVYKTQAPSYSAVYHSIYGPDVVPDKETIRYAIQNSLQDAGYADYLRGQPGYQGSQEFKQNYTSLQNVFRQIYGNPGSEDDPAIRQATLHGYDANQFASYLRSQPQYTNSPEYLSRSLALLDALGIITGRPATLQPGEMNPRGGTAQTIPTDPNAKPASLGGHDLSLVPGYTQ